MTSGITHAYGTLVLGNPKLILILLFAILVFFGYHTQDFRLDASADSLLLEDDHDLKIFRQIHERYPSADLLIVTYTPNKDLFSDDTLNSLSKLREELKQVDSVESVFTILDAPLLKSSDKPFTEVINDIPTLEDSSIDREQAKNELLNSAIFRELLISKDAGTTALLLSLTEDPQLNILSRSRNVLRSKRSESGLSTEEAKSLKQVEMYYINSRDTLNEQRHLDIAVIRNIIQNYDDGGKLYLGGVPMITDDMVTFVRNDLIIFGGGVLAFLIVVLTIIFRELLCVY